MADIRVCSHGKTSPCDYCKLTVMLALRKQLDPDAPDAVVIPADLLARAPPNDIKADLTEAAPSFVKAIADIYAEIHYPE